MLSNSAAQWVAGWIFFCRQYPDERRLHLCSLPSKEINPGLRKSAFKGDENIDANLLQTEDVSVFRRDYNLPGSLEVTQTFLNLVVVVNMVASVHG